MHHLYGVKSSANTNISATNIPAFNTSSAEICSIATDDMTLSNELQNAITPSKTAKEFDFGSLQKEFNLFETIRVRTPNLDMLLSVLRTIQPTATDSERVFSEDGNFKTKIRRRMKFRVLNAVVFFFFFNIIF
jgi:hypothetical protein